MNIGILSRFSKRGNSLINISNRFYSSQLQLEFNKVNGFSNYEKDKAINNKLYEGKTGGEIIVLKLKNHNVSNVFMYSGGAVMPVIDAFHEDPDFNYYITAHEQSLGHAATGYAKASGKTGVAIVTSGPGLTNMITPILDATNDSSPLLCLSGQVPLIAMGSNAFQECPATDITKSITKWNYCLQSTEEIPYIIDYAMYICQNGKKGAVHIDIPKCISSGKYCSKKALNNLSNDILKKCNNINNLKNTIKELFEYNNGPILCDFKVLGEECYPLVAPGKALDDMILWDTNQSETKQKMIGQMVPS